MCLILDNLHMGSNNEYNLPLGHARILRMEEKRRIRIIVTWFCRKSGSLSSYLVYNGLFFTCNPPSFATTLNLYPLKWEKFSILDCWERYMSTKIKLKCLSSSITNENDWFVIFSNSVKREASIQLT